MNRERLKELFVSIAIVAAKAQAAIDAGDDSAEIGEHLDDIQGDAENIAKELWGRT